MLFPTVHFVFSLGGRASNFPTTNANYRKPTGRSNNRNYGLLSFFMFRMDGIATSETKAGVSRRDQAVRPRENHYLYTRGVSPLLFCQTESYKGGRDSLLAPIDVGMKIKLWRHRTVLKSSLSGFPSGLHLKSVQKSEADI